MPGGAARVPIERTDVVARHEDEVTALVRHVYADGPASVRLLGGGADYVLRSVTAGQIRVDRIRNSFYFHAEVGVFEDLVCFQFLRGGCQISAGNHEWSFTAGDAGLYWLGLPHHVEAAPCDAAMLRLPWPLVATIAEQQTGIHAGDLRFAATKPVSAASGRSWNKCLTFLHDELMAADTMASNPLVNTQLVHTAAIGVLTTFPNTTMTTGYVTEPAQLATATVRRAMAYIEGNADQPITLSDIAIATGSGARALQNAFRHHHDTTPLAYLRRVRLEHAHRDLQTADPTTGDTVAAIAARWGFTHLSRFANAYHDAYGQLPSYTLRT